MNTQIKNILFPTDFSSTANNSLRFAVAMAKRQKAKLHILHVTVHQYIAIFAESAYLMSMLDWKLLENASKEMLNNMVENINSTHDIEIIPHTAIGKVADSIQEVVNNEAIDIVVMGSHGEAGFRDFYMGSNAYATIKDVNCPVLTIPENCQHLVFENVLFPVRNVRGNNNKYETLLPILKANKSHVELLGLSQFNDTDVFENIADKISEFTAKLKSENIEVTHRNEYCDNIADYILDYSEKKDIDLLVITATIDSDWKNFFLGSFTQRIVNNAQCPVLSIKPLLRVLPQQDAIQAVIHQNAVDFLKSTVSYPIAVMG